MNTSEIDGQERDASENVVRKKELFDHVANTTSLNKKAAREAVEATLAFLWQALSAEKQVIIPPLGKITSKRVKVGTDKEKLIHKLSLRAADKVSVELTQEPLAEPEQ